MRFAFTWTVGPGTLVLAQGDIAGFAGDAVVNAANSRLAGGGGVDGAIHRAAGREKLQAACQEIVARQGQVPAGSAAVTPGFDLKARFIIHAVGPIWRGGGQGEPEALRAAYRSCLGLAHEHGAARAAFPAISCGAYGFPEEQAAPLALAELAAGLRQGLVSEAVMTLFSAEALDHWAAAARALFGPPDPSNPGTP